MLQLWKCSVWQIGMVELLCTCSADGKVTEDELGTVSTVLLHRLGCGDGVRVQARTSVFLMNERPTKCIFKINHIFRISVLLLHVSALQECHLQGAQMILIKLGVCYVISAE
jgi:hypothetical protein